MLQQSCINCGKKVEWTVLAINLALFILKLAFGIISQSRALYSDAFESLANLIITVVVLITLKLASRDADEKYPYGYGKIEFLASGIVNTMLMIAAIIFTIASFRELIIYEVDKPPRLIAICAAVISIIANQIAFDYGRCAGEKMGSSAIQANAMLSRIDMGTSVAVIFAVVGSNLGFTQLDHVVSILIGILIVKVTLGGAKEAINGLMDVSMHQAEHNIRNLTEDIDGVQRVGDVKARLIGRKVWIDMDVFIPDGWSLNRGLETVRKIKEVLHRKMKNISKVSVQLFPLTGEEGAGNKILNISENARTE